MLREAFFQLKMLTGSLNLSLKIYETFSPFKYMHVLYALNKYECLW